jgi:hypothetical protein
MVQSACCENKNYLPSFLALPSLTEKCLPSEHRTLFLKNRRALIFLKSKRKSVDVVDVEHGLAKDSQSFRRRTPKTATATATNPLHGT